MDSTSPLQLAATAILARDGRAGLEVLMLERPARGSFPNAWVFPGGRVDSQDGDAVADEAAAARQAAAREVFEETQLRVDPAQLRTQALWSPPEDATPRYRTWFFVAPTFCGTPVAAQAEAVRLGWMRPAEALDAHARDELTLVVPTWVTLHGLAAYASVADLLGGLADHIPEHFATRHREGGVFCWAGDASYEDAAGSGSGRHRLETVTRPWQYLRS